MSVMNRYISETKFTAKRMMNNTHRSINEDTMMPPILKKSILAELTAEIENSEIIKAENSDPKNLLRQLRTIDSSCMKKLMQAQK
jgi:hypothetical protein